MKDNSIYNSRPDWHTYFLKIALEVTTRSNDPQTQCGAVITSSTNEILATGYNGHIRNIKDGILPNLRPDKYDWMIHAEHNAILSCARNGKSTLETSVYITHEPCLYCYQYMWQVGVQHIWYVDQTTHGANNEKQREKIELFKSLTHEKMFIHPICPVIDAVPDVKVTLDMITKDMPLIKRNGK